MSSYSAGLKGPGSDTRELKLPRKHHHCFSADAYSPFLVKRLEQHNVRSEPSPYAFIIPTVPHNIPLSDTGSSRSKPPDEPPPHIVDSQLDGPDPYRENIVDDGRIVNAVIVGGERIRSAGEGRS